VIFVNPRNLVSLLCEQFRVSNFWLNLNVSEWIFSIKLWLRFRYLSSYKSEKRLKIWNLLYDICFLSKTLEIELFERSNLWRFLGQKFWHLKFRFVLRSEDWRNCPKRFFPNCRSSKLWRFVQNSASMLYKARFLAFRVFTYNNCLFMKVNIA